MHLDHFSAYPLPSGAPESDWKLRAAGAEYNATAVPQRRDYVPVSKRGVPDIASGLHETTPENQRSNHALFRVALALVFPPCDWKITPTKIAPTTAVKPHANDSPPKERKPHPLCRPRHTVTRPVAYPAPPSHLLHWHIGTERMRERACVPISPSIT